MPHGESAMTTVTISLPQDVKELAEAEAARAGHSLDEYVARLILSQADQPIDPATEAQLLKALDLPAREASAAEWQARTDRLRPGAQRAASRTAVLRVSWGPQEE